MKILVWQWGRSGRAPRLGVDWAEGFAAVPGFSAALSLSAQAELMRGPHPPSPDIVVGTYTTAIGYGARLLSLPWFVPWLTGRVKSIAPDVALCGMPGPLDLAMQAALQRLNVPMAVAVHDADSHPGDGLPFQMALQRRLVRRATALVTLSDHVANRLHEQGLVGGRKLFKTILPQPPFPHMPPVRAHEGPFRLLSFGRLLAYKGLDLLHEALAIVLPGIPMVVRIVGSGPEGPELAALRRLPGVTVENRWVPEPEIPQLLAWADGVVLSHREASQSGVAAEALAARRYLIATRVGGLVEQAGGDPAALLCDLNAASLASALREVLHMPLPGPRENPSQHACERLALELGSLAAK